jgi:hypothetical protein
MLHAALGIVFILYGILKLIAFFALVFVPPQMQDKLATISGLNLLFTGDRTVAGRVVEWVLVVFAVFSIVHGMALLSAFPRSVDAFIESHVFQYTFYTLCGIVLVIFYTLVLYTDLPIPKTPDNRNIYWTYGYLFGGSFIIVPVVWELARHVFPLVSALSLRHNLMLVTTIFIAVSIAAFATYVSSSPRHF